MFKRLSNLIKGFLSLFISGLEKSNPRALIEAEKENLRKQIATFNDNLASQAGFIERLMRQIKDLEQKERELTARAAANLKAGNRAIAAEAALQLQTVKQQLEENRKQLEESDETFKKMVKARDVSVKEARAKIEKLKRMLSEAEMMEAQAELQEMAQGMISKVGSSGDTINRLEEYLAERRDKAAGRARVASTGIDDSELEMKEAEHAALAEAALAEFEMAYGFSGAAEKKAEDNAEDKVTLKPRKELGPQKES